MTESIKKGLWFKIALGTGFVLGLLLVVRTLLSYQYVSGQLLTAYLGQRAGDYITDMQNLVRTAMPEDTRELQDLLEVFLKDEVDILAWAGVFDQQGEPIAFAGPTGEYSIDRSTIDSILISGEQSVVREVTAGDQRLLVVTTPFRFRLDRGRTEPAEERTDAGSPRFPIAQVALSLEGVSDAYAPLRRNLAISIAAAFALLISITIVILRLKSYLKGRELEQQLELASQIQRELLPPLFPAIDLLELSTEFRPAQGVAGDFYDVFVGRDGRVTMVLGDVSGKGIPASLIMASLLGSIRSSDFEPGVEGISIRLRQLNRELYNRTPPDHFATLVWVVFDPTNRTIDYVNAGHPNPFLIRHALRGHPQVDRLDQGGPPLGVIPESSYSQDGRVVEAGDLFLLYSDGLNETSDRHGDMYGDDRVMKLLLSNSDCPIEDLRELILKDVTSFSGGAGPQDDLTLMLARIP